jgi:la-related protein 1
MATSQEKPEAKAHAAVPFSYAQAAKGLTSSGASTTSRVTSGSITPAKDSHTLPPLTSEIPAGTSWAEDTEKDIMEKESRSSTTTAVDGPSSPRIRSPITQASTFLSNGVTGPSSPEFGASSESTLAREDDEKSNPTSLSEAAWEHTSVADGSGSSTVKPAESIIGSPIKGKKKNGSSKRGEKGENKKSSGKDAETKIWPALQEAPIPSVNIWAMRAQEAKTKPVAKSTPTLQPPTTAEPESSSKASHSKPNEAQPQTKTVAKGESESKNAERPAGRTNGEDSSSQRREPRGGVKGSEKPDRAPKVAPPPARDPSSWPTPDIVKDEDFKKSHDKPEKGEKEQDDSAVAPAHKAKKPAWTALEFTPSVNFKTPLPGSSTRKGGAGRGGRGGGREQGGRGGASGNGEKGNGSQSSPTNGESTRRTRPDGGARNTSPAKAKRAASNEPSSRKDTRSVNGVKETPSKDVGLGLDGHAPKALNTDEESKQSGNAQHNTFPRTNNPSKPKQSRRADLPFVNGEKRKEGDVGNNDAEGAAPSTRGASIPGQGEGE